MSNFYSSQGYASSIINHTAYPAAMPSYSHHSGRSRRSARFNAQNSSRHRHTNRNAKEIAEAALVASFRTSFEAARSFELEDDEMFCPWHLLTQDDLQSIHSSSSDRSSLSSGSPDSSPLQQQLQPTSNFQLPSNASQHLQQSFQQSTTAPLKLHQPSAQRIRNAIPIVDPNSRSSNSPPPSVSPARQIQNSFVAPHW